jgi:FkbM family methyltransferase
MEIAQRPGVLPLLIRSAAGQGAHLGQLIRLSAHRRWITTAGINTVIDVGAHTGQFSSAMRALLPETQIFAFEPLPDCFDRLMEHLGRTGNFRGFRVALGDREGPAKLWESSFSESSSFLPMADLHKKAFPWTARSTSRTVQMATLDSYVDELELVPEVLLKLDVQGFEHQVLLGGLRMLERIRYVLAEVSFQPLYEGQADFRDVHELLCERGFRYAGSIDQMTSPLDGSILQADALFTRHP